MGAGRAPGWPARCGESAGATPPAEPKLRRVLGLEEAGGPLSDLQRIRDSVTP